MALITDGTPIMNKYYYQQDALGNVYGPVDESGALIHWNYGHMPWGDWEVAGSFGATAADSNRLKWKGLLYEGNKTGLYYVRARWYDPRTHRFLSEDPIGLAGGVNRYTFGDNDPVNSHDPTGMFAADRGACSIMSSCGRGLQDLIDEQGGGLGRPLTPEERASLGELCTQTNVCDKIRIYDQSLTSSGLTLGYNIFLPAGASTYLLAHEVYHSVQYQQWGSQAYYMMTGSDLFDRLIGHRFSDSPYISDPYRLPPRVTAGDFFGYNAELQATIVGRCFAGGYRSTESCAASPYHPTR
jgi:RHS repeat-associated protein